MSKLILPKRGLIKPTRRSLITGAAALMAMPYIAKGQTLLKSGKAGGGSTGTQVIFDAGSSGSGAGGMSWMHTPADTPTCIFVGTTENGGTVTDVKYNGVSMSQVNASASATEIARIWAMANPPAGAQTVQVVGSGLNLGIAATFRASSLSTAMRALSNQNTTASTNTPNQTYSAAQSDPLDLLFVYVDQQGGTLSINDSVSNLITGVAFSGEAASAYWAQGSAGSISLAYNSTSSAAWLVMAQSVQHG